MGHEFMITARTRRVPHLHLGGTGPEGRSLVEAGIGFTLLALDKNIEPFDLLVDVSARGRIGSVQALLTFQRADLADENDRFRHGVIASLVMIDTRHTIFKITQIKIPRFIFFDCHTVKLAVEDRRFDLFHSPERSFRSASNGN